MTEGAARAQYLLHHPRKSLSSKARLAIPRGQCRCYITSTGGLYKGKEHVWDQQKEMQGSMKGNQQAISYSTTEQNLFPYLDSLFQPQL